LGSSPVGYNPLYTLTHWVLLTLSINQTYSSIHKPS